MFEMKPEYYIGIDMIDQEHKQLFDYASEATNCCRKSLHRTSMTRLMQFWKNCVIIP